MCRTYVLSKIMECEWENAPYVGALGIDKYIKRAVCKEFSASAKLVEK